MSGCVVCGWQGWAGSRPRSPSTPWRFSTIPWRFSAMRCLSDVRSLILSVYQTWLGRRRPRRSLDSANPVRCQVRAGAGSWEHDYASWTHVAEAHSPLGGRRSHWAWSSCIWPMGQGLLDGAYLEGQLWKRWAVDRPAISVWVVPAMVCSEGGRRFSAAIQPVRESWGRAATAFSVTGLKGLRGRCGGHRAASGRVVVGAGGVSLRRGSGIGPVAGQVRFHVKRPSATGRAASQTNAERLL